MFRQYVWGVRTAHSVPMRLVLVDRRIAILPSGGDQPELCVAVVRHPAVVESLRAAFDLLWESAVPLPTEPVAPDDCRERVQRDILRHLAAGHKDEVVARRLGLALRTCRRHIAEIMEHLGATSRFQAGVLAERRLFSTGRVTATADGNRAGGA
jgi:DNA-binding NarL/FixJ family response regulator